MSDNNTPTDPALDAIDEQVRELNACIDADTRRLEVNTAIRAKLIEIRATISRKPGTRRSRKTTRPLCAGVMDFQDDFNVDPQPDDGQVAEATVPTLWASPEPAPVA